MSENYISWLMEKRRAANAPAVAEDSAEADVPIEKCRAKGGPGHCAVHGPRLKKKLDEEDSVSASARKDVESMCSAAQEMSPDVTDEMLSSALSEDLASCSSECDTDAAASAMKAMADGAKAKIDGVDGYESVGLGKKFGSAVMEAEADSDMEEGSAEFEDLRQTLSGMFDSIHSDFRFNSDKPRFSLTAGNGKVRAEYMADLDRAEKYPD